MDIRETVSSVRRDLLELSPGESPEQHRRRTGRCPPGFQWNGTSCGEKAAGGAPGTEPKPKPGGGPAKKPPPLPKSKRKGPAIGKTYQPPSDKKKPAPGYRAPAPKPSIGQRAGGALKTLKNKAVSLFHAAKTDAKAVAKAAKDWHPKVKAKLERMPNETKAFFTDPEFRRAASQTMGAMAKQGAKKFAKRAVEVAKHEIHEFKHAGEALKTLAKTRSFKKLSKDHKKALGTVTKHMAITAAASAATASGLGIPAAFAKGLARHFAAKMAGKVFEKLHLGDEISHLTHLFHDDEGDAEIESALTRVGELLAQEFSELVTNLDPAELEDLMKKIPEETPAAPQAETRSRLENLVREARLTIG